MAPKVKSRNPVMSLVTCVALSVSWRVGNRDDHVVSGCNCLHTPQYIVRLQSSLRLTTPGLRRSRDARYLLDFLRYPNPRDYYGAKNGEIL